MRGYLDKLAAEQVQLQESFVEVWKRFNTKDIQSKTGVGRCQRLSYLPAAKGAG
ncbi:MAG: hypothetical protein U0694_09610 [Anaerolineae bacterium]